MRHRTAIFALSIALLGSAGCKSTSANHIPEGASSTPTGLQGKSLAEMEAEYAALRKTYLADCRNGTPEQIRINQPLCDQERAHMAPLGRALGEAEVKAATKATQAP